MSKQVQRALEACAPGDLICVEWCDASTGKTSMNGGVIDVPVRSWGVFLGLMGTRMKHIMLAQNSFRYLDGLYDLDYTAIPVGWTLEVSCLQQAHLPLEVARELAKCFLNTHSEARKNTAGLRSPRTYQQHLRLHGGRD